MFTGKALRFMSKLTTFKKPEFFIPEDVGQSVDLALGCLVPSAGGTFNIHIYAWDRGEHREVQLTAAPPAMPGPALKTFVAAFRATGTTSGL